MCEQSVAGLLFCELRRLRSEMHEYLEFKIQLVPKICTNKNYPLYRSYCIIMFFPNNYICPLTARLVTLTIPRELSIVCLLIR